MPFAAPKFLFVATLCSAIAWVFTTMPLTAQQRSVPFRVGVLTPVESDKTPSFSAFRNELRERGYIEGKSIILDFRFAKGHTDVLPGLAAELAKVPVDIIVVDGTTAARAALNVTQSIPILQAAGGDPVVAGLAPSYSRPGGNFSGFSIRSDELAGKRLELLKRAFPGIKKVSVMLDPTSVVTPPVLRATEKAAANLDIPLTMLSVSTPEGLNALGPADLAAAMPLSCCRARCFGIIAILSSPLQRQHACRQSIRNANTQMMADLSRTVLTFPIPSVGQQDT